MVERLVSDWFFRSEAGWFDEHILEIKAYDRRTESVVAKANARTQELGVKQLALE